MHLNICELCFVFRDWSSVNAKSVCKTESSTIRTLNGSNFTGNSLSWWNCSIIRSFNRPTFYSNCYTVLEVTEYCILFYRRIEQKWSTPFVRPPLYIMNQLINTIQHNGFQFKNTYTCLNCLFVRRVMSFCPKCLFSKVILVLYSIDYSIGVETKANCDYCYNCW